MMKIQVLKVNQWLDEWDGFNYSESENQRKPDKFFYLASIPVSILRRLSGVSRRGLDDAKGRQRASGPRGDDMGIQRGFEEDRAIAISKFVRGGYPWATIREREQKNHLHLRKPGWLPTSLVVNINTVEEKTSNSDELENQCDALRIESTDDGSSMLVLPDGIESIDWTPKESFLPMEVIDGQHRLLAFAQETEISGQFELPVVIFVDLDISWKAYLFWTINITPKRIGPSLAYDLFPLLRTQDWLESPLTGPLAYREARAQALTEALWSHPSSPWLDRIGMLGRERGKVTQAAFVRSLTLSYIRTSPVGARPGGLFGSLLGTDQLEVLSWSRAQQAAFLIFLWSELEEAIKTTDAPWAQTVRDETREKFPDQSGDSDPALSGIYSLLATDQGVRGFLQVSNDFSFSFAHRLEFNSWSRDRQSDATDPEEVTAALNELKGISQIADFLKRFCKESANFNWSSSVTPNLPIEIRNQQALYRTGSGYREVRRQLLLNLRGSQDNELKSTAINIVKSLNYE